MTIYAVLIADAPVLAKAFRSTKAAEAFKTTVLEQHPTARIAVRSMELDESYPPPT